MNEFLMLFGKIALFLIIVCSLIVVFMVEQERFTEEYDYLEEDYEKNDVKIILLCLWLILLLCLEVSAVITLFIYWFL